MVSKSSRTAIGPRGVAFLLAAISLALPVLAWAQDRDAALRREEDRAIAAFAQALTRLSEENPAAAVAHLESAVGSGHLLLALGPDAALSARVLLARLTAQGGAQNEAARYAREAAAIVFDNGPVDRALASTALLEYADLLQAAGHPSESGSLRDRAVTLGGARLQADAVAEAARVALSKRQPEPRDSNRVLRLDERSGLHARISLLESLAAMRPGEAGLMLLKTAAGTVAARIGETEQYALEVGVRMIQAITAARPLAEDELSWLARLARVSQERYGPWNELAQGFRYLLIRELERRGERHPVLDLELARLQLAADLGAYSRPFSSRDPAGAFRADLVSKNAHKVRTLAIEALDLPLAELVEAGLDPDGLVDIAYRAAQLELIGPISLATRAAALRAQARKAGMFYTHNWDGQMARLEQEWQDLMDRIDRESPAGLRQSLEGLRTLQAFVDHGEAKVASAVPGFHDLLVPPTIGPQNGTLDAETALILIAAGPPEERGHPIVFAQTREGLFHASPTWSTPDFAAAVLRYRDSIQGVRGSPDQIALRAPLSQGTSVAARPLDLDLGHEIYRQIFGAPEIAASLRGKTTWIIAAQDPFLSIPFAALPMVPGDGRAPTAGTLRDTMWLGLERDLGFVNSLADVVLVDRRPAERVDPPRTGYVGFGDPAFSGPRGPLRAVDMQAVEDDATRVAAVAALPRLPATSREILETATLFPPDARVVRLADRASEAELHALSATGALRGISVLHFATHGILDDGRQDGVGAALALSPPPVPTALEPGLLDDGLLTVSEISLLQIDAGWVVLSACDTAAGGEHGGRALTGLASTFLLAGARNILATHWAVEDDTAQRVVANTVRGMSAAGSASRALRESIAGIVADTSRDHTALPLSHPFVWAPFILYASE